MMKDNGSYCPLIFNEIYADSSGEYRLCCHAQSTPVSKKYKSQTHKPFDYFLSKEMEENRNKVLSGEKIPACTYCYKQEETNPEGESYRQRKIRQYQFSLPTHVDKVNLKLRINGSYCNLSCYMCIPYNSSSRRNEMNKIYPEGWDFFSSSRFAPVKFSEYELIVQDILDNIEKVQKIHITGGEPLQLPNHWKLIERIPAEHAKNIDLVYDTNLTELRYKNHSVYDIVDKFKHVHFGVSCDHFGKKLEWIRYPIDVKKFEQNLKDCKDIVSQLNCTVSILNIHDLIEIERYYYQNFKLKVVFNNVARGPQFLSICNFDDKIKKQLIKKYSHLIFVVDELKKPSWGLLEQGKEYCQRLSDHRGFQYKELWPNL